MSDVRSSPKRTRPTRRREAGAQSLGGAGQASRCSPARRGYSHANGIGDPAFPTCERSGQQAEAIWQIIDVRGGLLPMTRPTFRLAITRRATKRSLSYARARKIADGTSRGIADKMSWSAMRLVRSLVLGLAGDRRGRQPIGGYGKRRPGRRRYPGIAARRIGGGKWRCGKVSSHAGEQQGNSKRGKTDRRDRRCRQTGVEKPPRATGLLPADCLVFHHQKRPIVSRGCRERVRQS